MAQVIKYKITKQGVLNTDGTFDATIITDIKKWTEIDGVYQNDTLHIPYGDEANTDYQEYLQWVAEGNTPEPADEVTE